MSLSGVISTAWRRLSLTGAATSSQDTSSTPLANANLPTELSTNVTEATHPRRDSAKRSAVILLLGRSGAGKTYFAGVASADRGSMVDPTTIEPTMNVSSRYLKWGSHRFKLVDTPGFDNPAISDTNNFVGLAEYFLESSRLQTPVTGIIYIHRTSDNLESRMLTQNMNVLLKAFIGEANLSRLTIAMVSRPGTRRSTSSVQSLSRSAIFRAAQEGGARVVHTSLDQKGIDEILKPYTSQRPMLLRIQQDRIRDPSFAAEDLIQELLGYHETASVGEYIEEQIKKRLVQHTEQLRVLEGDLDKKEAAFLDLSDEHGQIKLLLGSCQEENHDLRRQLQKKDNEYTTLLSHLEHQAESLQEMRSVEVARREIESRFSELSQTHKQTKQQLASSREEVLGLRQHLQQTQSEYASLRSQLQLQENIEQSDIVQSLKDLNRDIDDFGRSISEYICDNYVQNAFEENIEDLTALNARQLPQLKAFFGHAEGKSSLVASSTDVGMPVEDFLDYGIRVLLCKQIYQTIFQPFHPAVDPAWNEVVSTMYVDIQKREPQAVAAKWRANCFKGIYRPDSPETVEQRVKDMAHTFIAGGLSRLAMLFFGSTAMIRLSSQHLDQLVRLLQKAWDWNSTLKGDVIVLGDFQQTYYDPLRPFDISLMNEFEAPPRAPQPKYILGTLGFGLVSSRATGGGKTPEVTVVVKATVATKNLYS